MEGTERGGRGKGGIGPKGWLGMEPAVPLGLLSAKCGYRTPRHRGYRTPRHRWLATRMTNVDFISGHEASKASKGGGLGVVGRCVPGKFCVFLVDMLHFATNATYLFIYLFIY